MRDGKRSKPVGSYFGKGILKQSKIKRRKEVIPNGSLFLEMKH